MTKSGEILSGYGQKNGMQETPLCSDGGLTQNHQIRDPHTKTVFQCSIKCEGIKTYNAAGNCPVCNMQLGQVAEVHQQYYL